MAKTITRAEVATKVGMSLPTLNKQIKLGTFPAPVGVASAGRGRRPAIWSVADVNGWMAAQKAAAKAAKAAEKAKKAA